MLTPTCIDPSTLAGEHLHLAERVAWLLLPPCCRPPWGPRLARPLGAGSRGPGQRCLASRPAPGAPAGAAPSGCCQPRARLRQPPRCARGRGPAVPWPGSEAGRPCANCRPAYAPPITQYSPPLTRLLAAGRGDGADERAGAQGGAAGQLLGGGPRAERQLRCARGDQRADQPAGGQQPHAPAQQGALGRAGGVAWRSRPALRAAAPMRRRHRSKRSDCASRLRCPALGLARRPRRCWTARGVWCTRPTARCCRCWRCRGCRWSPWRTSPRRWTAPT